VTDTYAYDEYGKEVEHRGNAYNYKRFAGEFWDPESGLLYLRNRYYHADESRFFRRDPASPAAEPNKYAYVGNRPVDFVDPNGLQADAGVMNVLPDWVRSALAAGWGTAFIEPSPFGEGAMIVVTVAVGGAAITLVFFGYRQSNWVTELVKRNRPNKADWCDELLRLLEEELDNLCDMKDMRRSAVINAIKQASKFMNCSNIQKRLGY